MDGVPLQKGLTKQCKVCSRQRPWSEFHLNRAAKDQKTRECKDCSREARARWRKTNPKRDAYHKRKDWLRSRYGLTLEQREQMAEDQNHECAICFRVLRLGVDHCHTTLALRGLLCNGCNGALGFVEKKGWLDNAHAYLTGCIESMT